MKSAYLKGEKKCSSIYHSQNNKRNPTVIRTDWAVLQIIDNNKKQTGHQLFSPKENKSGCFSNLGKFVLVWTIDLAEVMLLGPHAVRPIKQPI